MKSMKGLKKKSTRLKRLLKPLESLRRSVSQLKPRLIDKLKKPESSKSVLITKNMKGMKKKSMKPRKQLD
jgi:hypothetical protein